jgi:hypothetical protein
MLLDKDRTMDNVQKYNIYTNRYHRHKLLDINRVRSFCACAHLGRCD